MGSLESRPGTAINLSRFISERLEEILTEWETFARTLSPAADDMSSRALRDHAKQILQAVAADIQTRQSPEEQFEKSVGLAPVPEGGQSAASVHGSLRHKSQFSMIQLAAEFRALRATVLRLWLPHAAPMLPSQANDMVRFNEAIDQALAESILTFTARTQKTRDLFLAVLGHDLRAPLATMAAAGGMLSHPNLTLEQVAEIGARVSRGTRLMNSMVEDLIEYTRTQLGSGMPITLSHLNLRDICARVVEDAAAAYPTCRFDFAADGDLRGSFDGVRLHQLFTNLLVNAAQYGGKDSPVAVAARGESEAVVVEVTNQGPTIPEASWRSIFEPLVQLEPDEETRGPPRTSLGLGLFIAREIAHAHGGEIGVASEEGSGTTFTVRLPSVGAGA